MTPEITPPLYAPQAPTLRDQFAMAALTGLLRSDSYGPKRACDASATEAYHLADAMLAAREPATPTDAT